MFDYLWKFGAFVLKFSGHMDRKQWIFLFVIALFVGFVCTRGKGSRSAY